jgi:hypothetical protein
MSEAAPAGNGPVLVCGLGAFGQAVVCRLLPFAIPLRLIDQREPDWRTPELRQSLHQVLRLPRLRVVNPLQLSVGALVQALRPGPQLACFAANGETFNVRDCPLQDQRFQKIVRMDGGGKSLTVMPLEFYAPQMQHPQALTDPFRGLCQQLC